MKYTIACIMYGFLGATGIAIVSYPNFSNLNLLQIISCFALFGIGEAIVKVMDK